MSSGEQPAFPEMDAANGGSIGGMTYRQWLAGQVASGMAANSKAWSVEDDRVANYVWKLTDAILTAER